MIKINTRQTINVGDWDYLVEQTYGRPYTFQQQDGCKERQQVYIRIPDPCEDMYTNDTIPEEVNGDEMGVSFEAWLARDPKHGLTMFWERNFYPDVQMIANDLHARGLIPEGEYYINIDW